MLNQPSSSPVLKAASLTGSCGVNVLDHDFYKESMERDLASTREVGPVLGSLHPGVGYNVAGLKQISGLDEMSFHMLDGDGTLSPRRPTCLPQID